MGKQKSKSKKKIQKNRKNRKQSRKKRNLFESILVFGQEEVEQYINDNVLSLENHLEELCNLAKLCIEHNQLEKASLLISIGLDLEPENSELLVVAGITQLKAGSHQVAADCLTAALATDENNIEALSHLSDLLIAENQWATARPFLEKLTGLTPHNPLVFKFLGNAYVKLGLYADALKQYQYCLNFEPDSLDLKTNIGVCLRSMRCYKKAEEVLVEVLSQDSENPKVHNSLAWLYSDCFEYDKAVEHARIALAKQPESVDYLYCLGYLLKRVSKREESREVFKRALRLEPNSPVARFGYAELILADGLLQEGLAYYESRFDAVQFWLKGPWQVWDGKSAVGKTIFVQHEQGAGDTIQFCRYFELLQEAGARVIASCQPSLMKLLKTCAGIDELYSAGDVDYTLINADAQISLLSLMGVFGTTLQTIPAGCPYLHSEKSLVQKFEESLFVTDKLKVGLVWAGNPNQAEDHNRSMHLKYFEPLGDLTDRIQFYSLQMGEKAQQATEYGHLLSLKDLSSYIKDYADTAALMECMDIVISVCTSTLHLAGALARPTIALLHSAADWRWFLDRRDSPWYPTMTLIRQAKPRDWDGVIVELKQVLVEKNKDAGDRENVA